MARSLTIQHEETPSTSPLLTGFLLFVVAWMMTAAVVRGAYEGGPELSNTPASLLP